MMDDLALFFNDHKPSGVESWHGWFPENYPWLWAIGLVLTLLLISRIACAGFAELRGEDLGPKIGGVVLLGLMSLLGIFWHSIIVVVAVASVAALAAGILPAGLGYLCYRFKHR